MIPLYGTLGIVGNIFDYVTLVIHMLLSLSSFIFTVLQYRIVKNPLIIYQEYRLHAILFTFRSIYVSLIGILTKENKQFQEYFLWSGVLIIHLLVDYVTFKFGTPGITAVRVSKSYNSIMYKILQFFYSYYQFLAIGTHLTYNENLSNLGFNTLIAIQSSAFLMTLKRKNIIHWTIYTLFYSLALLISIYYMILTKDLLFFGEILFAFIIRSQFNVNKYVIWTSYIIYKKLISY